MITIRSFKDVSEPTLVGFEATLTTASGIYEFSSNGPMLDPESPFDGGLFGRISWPHSRFKISDDLTIEQQMFVAVKGLFNSSSAGCSAVFCRVRSARLSRRRIPF